MKIFNKEHIVAFDVDQTLVMHDDKGKIKITSNGLLHLVRRHNKHVRFLKQCKRRGYNIIVWSAAGYQWAHDVIIKLALEEYVDMIMTKPEKHVDDLPTHKILGSRIYIPE